MSQGEGERWAAGVVIDQRYLIKGELGEGSFGVVYEVVDRKSSMTLALKTLSHRVVGDRRARAMFKREGALLKRLEHPHVVKCYEVWKSETGGLCMTLEQLKGDTLGAFLSGRREHRPVFLLTVTEQIADAIAHLHARGVVHRDIKPENVFVERRIGRDWPVLMDFGLAFGLGATSLGLREGETNNISGTPLYMAPEQIDGRDLTPAIDVYALGSMVYEMLTGYAPFERPGMSAIDTMKAQLDEAPKSFKLEWELGEVYDLIFQALHKDPLKRPSAQEFAIGLRSHPLHPSRSQPYGWHTSNETPIRGIRLPDDFLI